MVNIIVVTKSFTMCYYSYIANNETVQKAVFTFTVVAAFGENKML